MVVQTHMAHCYHHEDYGTPVWSRCTATAIVAGDIRAVLLLGWGTDPDEKHLYCPAHHPQGPDQVAAQLAGTELFLRIADACDDTRPNYRSQVLSTMHRLRQVLDEPLAGGPARLGREQ